ncbi:MAG: response regulator [Nitrospirae bacterium]|nr:response regulator [Nitrospirota bacterium]
MRLTFRKKALLFIIPILVLVSFVYTYDAIETEKKLTRKELIKRSEVITTLASKTGELPILSGNAELLRKTASFIKNSPDVAFVSFYDKKMNLLMHDGVSFAGKLPELSSSSPMSFFEEGEFFIFYAPVFTVRASEDIGIFQEDALKQTKETIGWVRIGFSKSTMKETEESIVFRGLMLALIFSIGSSIIVSILITIATRPLVMLSGAVKRLKEGEYPEIKIDPTSDEIGELSVEFGRMTRAIKDRELKLIESEKKIRDLFERVEHAIFRLDKDGNIVETNRKFDELCGGTNRFCGLFSSNMEGLRLQKAISNGMKNSEERIIGSDGNELIVLMSVYPEFDEQGNITGFDGYFVDITEKKRLEETLIQTQKLDSLGMLAGGIAHDFNNILTGVLGYASLLKSTVSETDKTYKYIDTIEKSASRAANLAQQLLGFARKGKYIMTKLSINDLVKELASFVKETFDRSITIVLDCEENLPPVEGDSNQLYQAIMNLCINARDAMPEGGRLYIKTEYYLLHDEKVVDFFQIPAGGYVRVSVTDTGVGMPPDVRKRIFEPFYTTKGIGKGTGLGLAMVYGIAKNHEGYITVYSEIGLGTTVRLYLPKADGTVEEKRRDRVMNERPRKGTILLVDDEEVVRELGKDILEAYDYEVLLAVHGNEGVRIFSENKDRINLVILDMVMPEKGGRQTFKEIRTLKPDAKVLICSGYGEEQYFYELFEAGAAGFLQKPFQHTELLSKVEDAMAR